MRATRKLTVGRMERKAWALTVGLALGLWLVLSLNVPFPKYINWLIASGAITFVSFVVDKRRARVAHWRVPERLLLAQMAVGGVAGAWIGMQGLRHKTRKPLFRHVLWASTALHLVLLLALLGRL